MAAEGTGRKKWSLTQEALDDLLAHLSPDRDVAAFAYERIRRRLLTFFRCNNCNEPEACADETFDRIARRLPEIREFIPFLWGVARKVASESRDKRQDQLNEAVIHPSSQPDEGTGQSEENRRLEILEACLAKLPGGERVLISEYYRFDRTEKIAHRKRLAVEKGVAMDNLRVEVFRIRTKLRAMVGEYFAHRSPEMNRGFSPPSSYEDHK